MGRGGRGGWRGFWTRPRAAGESMEEVLYMRAYRQTDSFSGFFGVPPIDLAALFMFILCTQVHGA